MQGKKNTSFSDKVLATLFGAAILVVLAQVIWRYIFNNSLTWTEELSRYLFTWIIFLGAAVAIRDRIHIQFGFLFDRFPKQFRLYLQTINALLIAVFLIAVAIAGIRWVLEVRGTRSPALGLPVDLVFYGALPVASILGLYFVIRQFISQSRGSMDEVTPARPGEGGESW